MGALQIVSGSRDKTIKLWNTIGECKYTIAEPDGHTEWVSCVRFSPVTTNPIIVSAGWDKLVKVCAQTCPSLKFVPICNLCCKHMCHPDLISLRKSVLAPRSAAI